MSGSPASSDATTRQSLALNVVIATTLRGGPPDRSTVVIDFEGTVDGLHKAEREIMARPLRISPIELLDYVPSDPSSEVRLAAPGTIVVYLAEKGTDVLANVRQAIDRRDGTDLELANQFKQTFSETRHVPLSEAAAMLRESQVSADIRYGGTTVAPNMFVRNEFGLSPVLLPYNGGPISPNGFSLCEHYQPNSEIQLEALAVRNFPPLSEVEKAALDRIPPDQGELNVGTVVFADSGEGGCKDTWTDVGYGVAAIGAFAVTVSAVGIVAAGTLGAAEVIAATGLTVVYGANFDEPDRLRDALLKAQLSDTDERRIREQTQAAVDEMGPATTARVLLGLRRDLLTQRIKPRRT
jgi:hypothetical protein